LSWKYKIAKISGATVTGYFAGIASVSLTDQDIGMKLLQSLFGAVILGGLALGKMLNEYGERQKRRRDRGRGTN